MSLYCVVRVLLHIRMRIYLIVNTIPVPYATTSLLTCRTGLVASTLVPVCFWVYVSNCVLGFFPKLDLILAATAVWFSSFIA